MAKRRYVQLEDGGPTSWSEWIRPKLKGFRDACCDCSLVHEMQFKIDTDGRIIFRARRDKRATAAARRQFGFPQDADT